MSVGVGPSGPAVVVADAISPPVQLHHVLVGFQLGAWSADLALGLQVLSGVLYLWGVARLARRGRPWPAGRTAAFLGGLVVLFVAVVSGLASYGDSVFAVHVVQHLLIMMLAPPLLALGAPITLALQAARRYTQTRLLAVLHSPPMAVLSSPLVAGCLFYVSMWVDMESSFYPYSLRHPLAHDASHLVLFMLGCLFWWPVSGADRMPKALHPGIRLAALGLGMPFESFLAIALMSSRQTIAPQHTLADVHAGGEVFWIGAMMLTLMPAGLLAWRWLAAESRAEARAARASAAGGVGSVRARQDESAWEAEWVRRTGRVPPTVVEAESAWAPDAAAGPAPGRRG
ncbi:MAG TPA: cytochrome c oxidase assembly protein [Acidimicrobiales bacterium]|nr:cytochrome c oxidase assembly protein [Acidimicrobiales bacterium]